MPPFVYSKLPETVCSVAPEEEKKTQTGYQPEILTYD